MGLELSAEIKTGDKNCESSENMCDMKLWGWMRSPGRENRIKRGEGIGPPTYNVWVEGEPTHEKQGALGQKSEKNCALEPGKGGSCR